MLPPCFITSPVIYFFTELRYSTYSDFTCKIQNGQNRELQIQWVNTPNTNNKIESYCSFWDTKKIALPTRKTKRVFTPIEAHSKLQMIYDEGCEHLKSNRLQAAQLCFQIVKRGTLFLLEIHRKNPNEGVGPIKEAVEKLKLKASETANVDPPVRAKL